jgi:hypothetical protein
VAVEFAVVALVPAFLRLEFVVDVAVDELRPDGSLSSRVAVHFAGAPARAAVVLLAASAVAALGPSGALTFLTGWEEQVLMLSNYILYR